MYSLLSHAHASLLCPKVQNQSKTMGIVNGLSSTSLTTEFKKREEWEKLNSVIIL
jgi:hypothetical protein